MEQERTATAIHPLRRPGSGGSGGSGGMWDQGDNDPAAAMATVTHGPYAEQIPVADMTVSQIRQRYGDRFDIDPDSLPYIEGEPVGDDTIVQSGQVLMFARRAGEKGWGS